MVKAYRGGRESHEICQYGYTALSWYVWSRGRVGIVSSQRMGLVALGEGVYTVAEVSHILQPTMTARKVHYWLKKGILGPPIRQTRTGRLTLLTFEQLLKVRTVQHLRDDLHFSLQRVTSTVEELSSWVFDRLFAKEWYELRFYRSPGGAIAVTDGEHDLEVGTGQLLMPDLLLELDAFLRKTREDWERRAVDIEGYPRLVSNARVLGGAPVIKGTRVETAFISHIANEIAPKEILSLYPYVDEQGLYQALRFEHNPLAA
jgi:uncharacterized protein (DUF433 family)